MANKLISKIKNKLVKNKKSDPLNDEYMFSTEEIEDLKEQNKQKIENLKSNSQKRKSVSFTSVNRKLSGILDDNSSKEKETNELSSNEILIKEETEEADNIMLEDNNLSLEIEEKIEEEQLVETKEVLKEEIKEDINTTSNETSEESYINLSPKNQEIIMKKWNEIDLQQVDKDIIEGKDLLNHNYNITYGENAAKFVHDIRKKYEVVICYLIGFNNEKKGILNKTIFADRVDDEWKHLNRYIKLLEKIRSFRK